MRDPAAALGAEATAGEVAQRALLVCLICGAAPMCVLWMFTAPILGALGQDHEVCRLVQIYALWRIPGMVALVLAVIATKVMYATGNSKGTQNCIHRLVLLIGGLLQLPC